MMLPANGDTAAMSPMSASPEPSDWAKRGRTGFLEMVVEKMAKNPRIER
jgi:hypothetical protein